MVFSTFLKSLKSLVVATNDDAFTSPYRVRGGIRVPLRGTMPVSLANTRELPTGGAHSGVSGGARVRYSSAVILSYLVTML